MRAKAPFSSIKILLTHPIIIMIKSQASKLKKGEIIN